MTMKDDFLRELKDVYNKSLTQLPFSRYSKISIGVGIATFVSCFSAGLVLHVNILETSLWMRLLLALILSTVVTLAVEMPLLFYPHYKASSNKNRIEEGLIYTVSYMTILANSGFSVERMFDRAAEVEKNNVIKRLLSNFLTDISVFGFDLEKSLTRLSEQSPSKVFARFIDSVKNAIWTSGELKLLMNYQFDTQIQNRKEKTDSTLNSLMFLSEIYIALMVVAPIMMILMVTLLSALSMKSNAFASATILNSIVFVALPFMAAGFLVVLDTMRGAD
jgi:archaellum biogenesis protein FlaJ (TadC family)